MIHVDAAMDAHVIHINIGCVGTPYMACQHPIYGVSTPPIGGVSVHHIACQHPL